MPIRTATASGTVKNTGTTFIIFAVDLAFGAVLGPRTEVPLAPGAVSPTITLSVSTDVPYGQSVTALVHLHRVSPEPLDRIARSPTTTWMEPHILTGELVGFTPGISALAPEDEAWLEELLGEGVQRVT